MKNISFEGYKGFDISSNHEKGLCLETALLHAERELKVNVTFHNRLDPYGYVRDSGFGADNIFKHNGVEYSVECKNLGCYVGLSFGKRHIIERHVNVDKKIVAVSKMRYLGYPLRVLLFYLGFIIIEIGFQVSWYNFRKAVHILKRKLRRLLNIPLSLDCGVNNGYSYGYSVNSVDCSVDGNSYGGYGDGNVAVKALNAYFRRREPKRQQYQQPHFTVKQVGNGNNG